MRLPARMAALLLGCGFALFARQLFAQNVPQECAAMVAAIGMPEFKYERPDYMLLCRDGYLLAHNNELKVPEWVVERLKPDRFTGPGDRDALNNPFKEDPDLVDKKLGHATLDDYKSKSDVQKRSFDRGHMAPAADMRFSVDATIQSFYLSNMSPQQGIGLNRHIWKDLETLTRDWTCDREDLYVITGPIFDKDTHDTLGSSQVAVPDAFYKIVYEPRKQRAIAFILPNEKVDKGGKKSFDALKNYIAPLSEIEDRTGIRFLTKLSYRSRNRLGGLRSVMWNVNQGCTGK